MGGPPGPKSRGGIPPGAPGKPGLGKAKPGGKPGGSPGVGGNAAWGGGGPIDEVVVVAPEGVLEGIPDVAAGEVEVGDTGECCCCCACC